MKSRPLFTVAETARRVGIHADTLRRWVREGRIPEPSRDRNNWRVFSEQEVKAILKFARRLRPGPSSEEEG